MQHKILYRPSFAMAHVELAAGESIRTESGAMVDDTGGVWIIALLAGTAVVGGIGAFRGHASGIALAGGVGLSTAFFTLLCGRILQIFSLGSNLTPHVGGVAFVVAAAIGVVLAARALGASATAREHHGQVPMVLAILAALGTGLFLFGLLDPPAGVSITDHFAGGDATLNVAAWGLVGCMAVSAIGLLLTRSIIAAGLLAGQAAIWMFSWAAAVTELPQSAFVSFPGGTASTAGIGVTLLTAGAAAAAATSAGRPVRDPRPIALGPVQWALPAVALVVIGAVGAFGISEDQDDFGSTEFGTSSGDFDSSDFDSSDFDSGAEFSSSSGTIEPGDSVDGFIEPGEVDVYEVDGDGNQLVAFVEGFGNDSTLTITSSTSGALYDDDGAGNLNPELIFFPDGSSRLEIRAYGSGESFGYTLYLDYCCGD